MEFLAISGSLRSGSTNTAALEALALLAPAGVSIALYRGLAALPAFNADLDGERLPPAVSELRRMVERADGMIISSPEYARGIAGALKNLLDWLVGGFEFAGKPIALVGTSPRAEHAPAQLRLVLSTMAGRIIEPGCVTLPLLGKPVTPRDIAADPELAAMLRRTLAALGAACTAR